MYSYEFMYKRESRKDKFQYNDFVRQTDRPISEQKADIREKLLPNGIDKKLLKLVDLSYYQFSNNIVIQFQCDNESSVLLQAVGSYPNV